MTRSDLVTRLAERFSQLTQRDTEFAVKTMLDAMSDALARGHRIEIRGFGSFSINRRPPRMGRNPRSGEQVVIPEKLVPHFKPGKACARRWTPRCRCDADGPPAPPRADRQTARKGPIAGCGPHGRPRPRMARMRFLVWLFRAFLFFTLFAFALNNLQAATVQLVLRRASGTRRWSSWCWWPSRRLRDRRAGHGASWWRTAARRALGAARGARRAGQRFNGAAVRVRARAPARAGL
jgi:integration host factor subunit beta